MIIEWASAGAPLKGESGDLDLVAPFEHGVLLGVVDGLGHGVEAAAAARVAVEELRAHAGESVLALVERCHQALHNTRGAAMSLASIDPRDSSVTWIGIGNVEGALLRAGDPPMPPREAIPLRGGVVGFRLPLLRPTVVPICVGDRLILATDGIRNNFAQELMPDRSVQETADYILSRYGRGSDDALVLVARYSGGAR
jgi:phosphoserine phosphatase RsbX